MKAILAIAILTALTAALTAQGADNMKAFPPPDPGMKRCVLPLPKLADESAAKVQLIVGKTLLLDAANRYFLGGRIEKETIRGWGFPRYVVNKLGPLAGTLMGVDPNAPKVERFITLGGEPYLVRYNSRLPLVVYVPADAEVRYRIWRAEPDMLPIPES